jgi:hypothetical protein
MVEHHADNLPRTRLRGIGEHLLRLVLPNQPDGTLALDKRPCRPGGEVARSRCAGEAAAWAAVEPSCEPGTGQRSTIPSRQT